LIATASQIRAARALLGWHQSRLSEESGVSLATIKRMEINGTENSSAGNVGRVQVALETAGVEFVRGGVVMKD
jgi:transcriptional regulator with XRE-family HTH domain